MKDHYDSKSTPMVPLLVALGNPLRCKRVFAAILSLLELHVKMNRRYSPEVFAFTSHAGTSFHHRRES